MQKHVKNDYVCSMESVVLGGTAQFDDFNESANADDSKCIRSGCLNLDPSLAHSTFLKEWVGLRPGRETVRLEEETYRRGSYRQSSIFKRNSIFYSVTCRKRWPVHNHSQLWTWRIRSHYRLGLCNRCFGFSERSSEWQCKK